MFAASKSGSAAEPTDAQFNYVTMLLHGNGTNGAQNNTFLDSSTNNFTITRNGNTTQGTFTPYGSNWSNYFDGSSFLTFPYTSNYEWTASDFTVEAWVFPTSLTNWSYNNAGYLHSTMIGNHSATGVQDTWSFGPLSDGRVGFYYYSGGQQAVYSTATISANQWSHVAMTKTSSGITIFVNGVGTTATAVTGTPATDNYGMVIGKSNNTTLNGYVSNVRIVKGTAVYSGTSYTVPTAPLTAITNTQFLSCQSNRFIDNSTNAATITVNGSPSVQRFSPFSPTTAYSTSVIGGSGYFDGSGDYLDAGTNAAFAVGTGDFTIELWVYPTAFSGTYTGYFTTRTGGQGFDIQILNSSATLMLGNNSGAVISANNVLSLNTWQHICAVRSGSTNSLYVNGTRVATGTDSTNFTDNGAKVCSSGPSGGNNGVGYISNVRLVKGTAVYSPSSSTLTVPTAPLSAVSGTSLLLSYTNAGILDNAMMNDLETVGNAQISTSVKKYGTGSMYFDGTGDYLVNPYTPNNVLGSGDFTVEMWLYKNANVAYMCAAGTMDASAPYNTKWQLFADSPAGTKIQWWSDTSVVISTSTLSTGTWYHVAVTRASGTTRIFINGTLEASASDTRNYSAANQLWVGQVPENVSARAWNGYIDDLRITKGYARYTANFTAPTAAFADKG